MTRNELFTEPRRRALQNVLEGNVYLRRSGLSRTTWMLVEGSGKPPSQLPYNWLYEHDYIELLGGRNARLTAIGRLALKNIQGTR